MELNNFNLGNSIAKINNFTIFTINPTINTKENKPKIKLINKNNKKKILK